MLRVYFSGQKRPSWPLLAALVVMGLLAVVLVLALVLVGVVLFIPVALIGAAGYGLRRLVTGAGRLRSRDDGRSNVRVIPRDEG